MLEMYRHLLHLGLLRVLAPRTEGPGPDRVRPFHGALHHVMHCRQYALHGHGSRQYG